MGQLCSVNRLPKDLYNKVFELLDNPGITQREIVSVINTEAGENLLSFSSLNRFVHSMERSTGTKRGKTPPTAEECLSRIATALERIAFSLEK